MEFDYHNSIIPSNNPLNIEIIETHLLIPSSIYIQSLNYIYDSQPLLMKNENASIGVSHQNDMMHSFV